MNTTHALFNREWSVTIGTSGQPGKKYTGLQVVFDIEKTGFGSSNKAKIEIVNLSSLSRQQYQQPDPNKLTSSYQIELRAGYAGNPRTIFIGDIRTAKNKRNGESIVTTFECGTSEKPLMYATIDKSYPPGTKFYSVLQDLALALEVDVGAIIGIENQTYNNGLLVSGSVKTNLDKFCSKQKLVWSIQDGRLQIYPMNHHNGQTAVILSNQVIPRLGITMTGLIGVPSQNAGITQFTSLMNPSISPGTPVQIYSATINGDFFRVNKAHFQGDSHGDKWQIDCEASPIVVQQSISQAQGLDFSKGVIG